MATDWLVQAVNAVPEGAESLGTARGVIGSGLLSAGLVGGETGKGHRLVAAGTVGSHLVRLLDRQGRTEVVVFPSPVEAVSLVAGKSLGPGWEAGPALVGAASRSGGALPLQWWALPADHRGRKRAAAKEAPAKDCQDAPVFDLDEAGGVASCERPQSSLREARVLPVAEADPAVARGPPGGADGRVGDPVQFLCASEGGLVALTRSRLHFRPAVSSLDHENSALPGLCSSAVLLSVPAVGGSPLAPEDVSVCERVVVGAALAGALLGPEAATRGGDVILAGFDDGTVRCRPLLPSGGAWDTLARLGQPVASLCVASSAGPSGSQALVVVGSRGRILIASSGPSGGALERAHLETGLEVSAACADGGLLWTVSHLSPGVLVVTPLSPDGTGRPVAVPVSLPPLAALTCLPLGRRRLTALSAEGTVVVLDAAALAHLLPRPEDDPIPLDGPSMTRAGRLQAYQSAIRDAANEQRAAEEGGRVANSRLSALRWLQETLALGPDRVLRADATCTVAWNQRFDPDGGELAPDVRVAVRVVNQTKHVLRVPAEHLRLVVVIEQPAVWGEPGRTWRVLRSEPLAGTVSRWSPGEGRSVEVTAPLASLAPLVVHVALAPAWCSLWADGSVLGPGLGPVGLAASGSGGGGRGMDRDVDVTMTAQLPATLETPTQGATLTVPEWLVTAPWSLSCAGAGGGGGGGDGGGSSSSRNNNNDDDGVTSWETEIEEAAAAAVTVNLRSVRVRLLSLLASSTGLAPEAGAADMRPSEAAPAVAGSGRWLLSVLGRKATAPRWLHGEDSFSLPAVARAQDLPSLEAFLVDRIPGLTFLPHDSASGETGGVGRCAAARAGAGSVAVCTVLLLTDGGRLRVAGRCTPTALCPLVRAELLELVLDWRNEMPEGPVTARPAELANWVQAAASELPAELGAAERGLEEARELMRQLGEARENPSLGDADRSSSWLPGLFRAYVARRGQRQHRVL